MMVVVVSFNLSFYYYYNNNIYVLSPVYMYICFSFVSSSLLQNLLVSSHVRT
jgi:hypothetical protein